MPAARAAELTARFLAQFGTEGVRYFTNGVPREPMTDATFDTGVLVITPRRSGCFWVEDED